MTAAETFLEKVFELRIRFFTGVPCSMLTPLMSGVVSSSQAQYLPASNEGEALAIASGAWLAGCDAATMCQNSGLGNLVNPLTSLLLAFKIPVLLIISLRGDPERHDEPQHLTMGRITLPLLELIGMHPVMFPREAGEVRLAVESAIGSMRRQRTPVPVILRENEAPIGGNKQYVITQRDRGSYQDVRQKRTLRSRYEALSALLSIIPESAAVISTTGKCSRELFTLSDRPQHFYVVGSMGCASAIGLGVALHCPNPVLIIDGDGAALMRMEHFATIGSFGPRNLIHVVLDNGVHDSTGGQPTVSTNCDFAQIAAACGYPKAFRCDTIEVFQDKVDRALKELDGPTLINFSIASGSRSPLGRPTISLPDLALRFREFLSSAQ